MIRKYSTITESSKSSFSVTGTLVASTPSNTRHLIKVDEDYSRVLDLDQATLSAPHLTVSITSKDIWVKPTVTLEEIYDFIENFSITIVESK
ncbi:hypothetical protein CEW46_23930 [Bacillus cereus]|nr:hypothetical protein CEW46_23930 [Bacillus cereus]